MSNAAHRQGLTRAGSDGVIKTNSVSKVTPPARQNSSSEVSRRVLPPASVIRDASSGSPILNGSHGVLNGDSGSHNERATSVKKSPILPPRQPKNTSSSSMSSSTSSTGSVFRVGDPVAQNSNQDGQLSDVKKPLMPPSVRSTPSPITSPFSTMTSSFNSESAGEPKQKPLPSPPASRSASRSPSNQPNSSSTSGSRLLARVTEQLDDEIETKSEQSSLNQGGGSGSERDVKELESENEALKRRIRLLEEQQRNLAVENELLKRSQDTPSPSLPLLSPCEPSIFNGSPSNSEREASQTPSPLLTRESNGSSQSSSNEQGYTPNNNDPKKMAARMNITRVITRAKTSSPDLMVDLKPVPQPVERSVASNPPLDIPSSPNTSITSPLSPLSPSSISVSSTPSPTSLVTFGLASQSKRNAIKKSNGRGNSRDKKTSIPTSVASEPLPERYNSESPDNSSYYKTEKQTRKPTKKEPLIPGKFSSKNQRSIVTDRAKLFQQESTSDDPGNSTTTTGGKNKVKREGEKTGKKSVETSATLDEQNSQDMAFDRGQKESLSSESDDVFTNSNTVTTVQPSESSTAPAHEKIEKTPPKKPGWHRAAKSESQVLDSSSSSSSSQSREPKKGVVSKRVPLKSDISWIKSESAVDKTTPSRSESPSQLKGGRSDSPVRPYRSHQLLDNTSNSASSSSATPARPVPFRSQNSVTLHVSRPGQTPAKPAHHRSVHGLLSEDITGERGRVGSISARKGLRSRKEEKKRKEDARMSRSASDESIHDTLKRGTKTYSSQRHEIRTDRPPRPKPMRHIQSDRSGSRPASVMVEPEKPPRAWEDRDEDFSASCTVPGGLPPEKISKRKKNDSSGITKKPSFFSRLTSRPRDKDVPNIPAQVVEEEDGRGGGGEGDSDSSSEDEKGATIKYMPKLRPVSVRRPSQVEDDYDVSYPQLFERVFVVGLKNDPKTDKLTTEVTYTFPPRPPSETGRDETMESIPQFCFPDIDKIKPTTKFKSETFSFVLTNIEGSRRFGYCRRLLPDGKGARLPEVTCLVSPLGCFSLYEKILDHIEERRQISTTAVFTFLKAIVSNPFPKPGRSVNVRAFSARGGDLETVTFTRPLDSRLEHVDFSTLFSTLSPRKIIQIFSSMLMERRIILCSNNLSLLTGCAHALLALLYPFEWQHVFIPVLPGPLIDFCCSPLPYLMGMNPSLIPQLDDMETMEEALVVDLDRKKFVRKIGDEASILPSKLFQYLEQTLGAPAVTAEYQKSSPKRGNTARADEIITNTFMIFFVYLYGDYKQYMTQKSDGSCEFLRKEYVKKFSSKSIRRFLEAFHMTQMFENFLEQRENPLKSELTAQSTFERSTIHTLKERCMEIEIFSSKSKISRWRLRKRI